MRAILEIARHELAVALRTMRAVVLLGIYVVLAALGQLIYVLALNTIEKQARALLTDPNSPDSGQLIDLVGQKAYSQLVAGLAGVEPADMAPFLHESALLPMLLWGSLVFLPYIVVLTSFDQLSADLESRSLCYSILRAPRRALVLGKLLAHAILMTAVLLITGVLLVVTGAAVLDTISFWPTLAGLFTVLVLLIPYGLCYLGISAFASACVKTPFLALISAFGVILALWLISFLAHIPDEHAASFLQPLAQLSPAEHHSGFWMAGVRGPALSVAFYVGLGAVFTFLAIKRLETRDL